MSLHSTLYPDVPIWMRVSDYDPALGHLKYEDGLLGKKGHLWSPEEVWTMLELLENGYYHTDVDEVLGLPKGCSYQKHRRLVESGDLIE